MGLAMLLLLYAAIHAISCYLCENVQSKHGISSKDGAYWKL